MNGEHDWSSPVIAEEVWRATDVYVGGADGPATIVIRQRPTFGEESSEDALLYFKPSDVPKIIKALRECAKTVKDEK